jgi:hypothetical protein
MNWWSNRKWDESFILEPNWSAQRGRVLRPVRKRFQEENYMNTKTLFGILGITLALAARVQAQFDYTDNGNGTCTITWDYAICSECGEAVVIPATYAGLTVTGIGQEAFLEEWTMPSITIPASVTSIGNYAFENCFSLTSVYFLGNAPYVDADAPAGIFAEVSEYPYGNDPTTVYYLPGTTGWSTFSAITGVPAVLWNTPPTIAITSPTSGTIYSTSSSTISLGGTTSDNMGVVNVTWSNPQAGDSGTASGTTSWTANNISLASGTNVITVTAYDAAGNQSTATLTVTCLYYTGVNNVVADFSTNANPNGVWSYGWATAPGEPFQLASTPFSQAGFPSAVGWDNGLQWPDFCWIAKDFASFDLIGTIAYYPDTLHMDPQSYAVMARFTAPGNGIYSVSGLFRLEDTDTNPHDLIILVNGNTTNFYIFTSGGTYNSEYPFNFSTALTQDETLDFVVAYNGDFNNLGTGLKVTIGPLISGLYNTGVNNDGTLATLDTADIHYALVSQPSGSAGTAWVVAPFPSAWWSGATNANWLSPVPGVPGGIGYSADVGQYDYRLVFNMVDALGHPLDPTRATITGNWAADNLVSLLLNGIPVATNDNGFSFLSSFAVSSGFCAGTNTLDFLVFNTPPAGANPSGLLVSDLSGTAALFAPMAGTAYYARPANISLKIAISDLLTNVTDADGFPIALVGVGTDGLNLLSTNGTTLFTNSAYILYTNSVTPNVNDSFNYTVCDALGQTSIGTVLITINNNNIVGQTNVNLTVSSTNVTANFFGVPGFRYTVDRSTNLTQGLGWVPISTNTAPANGLMQVVDNFQDLGIPIPPVPASAYYRLRYNPSN